MYTYNTNQPLLKLKEYGRNVQKLVTRLEQIKDKPTRTKYAEAIVKVMGIVHSDDTKPNTKQSTDYLQKRWDDLFIISDYKADVDTPYQTPSKEVLITKPQSLTYLKQTPKYRHYGRHIELFIKKALEVTDPCNQVEVVKSIAKLVKNFSAAWNKDNLDVNTVMEVIKDLAGDKLSIDLEKLKSECNFNTPTKNLSKDNKKKNHP